MKFADFLLGPPPVITIMPTGPGRTRAGVTQVSTVLSTTVKDEALISPTITSVAPVKSVPVTVTIFPPVVLPKLGEMPVIFGVVM